MSKKQTGKLQVLTEQSLTEKELVLNPNDGFDLGLMMTEAAVELMFTSNSDTLQNYRKYPSLHARLIQKNDCRPGTVKLGPKSILKLKGNTMVSLCLEEKDGFQNLFIKPA